MFDISGEGIGIHAPPDRKSLVTTRTEYSFAVMDSKIAELYLKVSVSELWQSGDYGFDND